MLLDLKSYWLHDASVTWGLSFKWLITNWLLCVLWVGVEAPIYSNKLSIKRLPSQELSYRGKCLCLPLGYHLIMKYHMSWTEYVTESDFSGHLGIREDSLCWSLMYN